MGPAWAYAFTAATMVTWAGTPVLRRIALATEFVDHPAASHKTHKSATPYLGGIGLIVAVLIALLFADRLTPQVAIIATGGSLVGCLGLLDDHQSVSALFRFTVELGVAAVALVAGLRIHATDIPAIDGVITLIWIVGVTNAVNLLDNMDGLAAGVSGAAAAAIFALAVLGEQLVTATLAAGLAGACLGFLAHNKRPATIFMGDTGSLFLGFVLAVATVDVSPALSPPASFAVPLILLSLPVLDTAMVTICRLRRGRPISEGGRDHLSHRLVAFGLSPGTAVAVLVGIEVTLGVLAVLAGRQVLPLAVTVVGTAVVLVPLAALAVRTSVYTETVTGLPRRMTQAAFGLLAAGVLLAGPAVVALSRVHTPGNAGAAAARHGIERLKAGDGEGATADFRKAEESLRRAHGILKGRLISLGLLLPGLRANVATSRAVVDVGLDVSRAATSLSSVVEASALPLGQRAEPAREAERLAPALAASASVLQESAAGLAGYDRPYLAPSLSKTVRELRTTLTTAAVHAATAAEMAYLAPALLGQDGDRHYFVAIQDSAELRSGGGVIHFWGDVVAEGGRLRLTHLGPVEELNATGSVRTLDGLADFLARYREFDPANTWQNVNVSPDFSVTGEVISRLYPQSGGRHVDGVLAIDMPGLAALLELAGPVSVGGWPEALTGANLADIVLRQVPQKVPDEVDRRSVLSGLYQRTLEALLAADLGPPARLAAGLRPIVAGGHLLLYASRAEEEGLYDRIGAAGRVPSVTGDSLLVVNQNLTGTPVDAQLRRRIRYDVRLDPGMAPAALSGRAEVTVTNDAARENRTYLSVYSPFGLTSARPDVATATELGRHVYSTSFALPPQQSRTLVLDLEGRVPMGAGNWYELDLPHQTSLTPDDVEVSLSVPSGWRIAEARGPVQVVDARHAVARLPVSTNRQLAVRLERTPWSRLWARVGG